MPTTDLWPMEAFYVDDQSAGHASVRGRRWHIAREGFKIASSAFFSQEIPAGSTISIKLLLRFR